LEDTYRFISMDKEVEKAKTQARNEGIIKATANKEGAIQSSSSKQTKTESKGGLSDSQKAMAQKLGVSEADYLKNIQTDDED
jgi:phage I-like protein